jgi:Phage derived protein Gp49-like (DUF891)
LRQRTASDVVLHSSQIRGELWELRCHFGRELYRVLYRRSRGLIVLLHAFRKDTGRIPEAEIQIAEDRWADFKARMDTLKRRPPKGRRLLAHPTRRPGPGADQGFGPFSRRSRSARCLLTPRSSATSITRRSFRRVMVQTLPRKTREGNPPRWIPFPLTAAPVDRTGGQVQRPEVDQTVAGTPS